MAKFKAGDRVVVEHLGKKYECRVLKHVDCYELQEVDNRQGVHFKREQFIKESHQEPEGAIKLFEEE